MDVSNSRLTPITSSEFRQNNKILFECPIRKQAAGGQEHWADHIDLNGNNEWDSDFTKFFNLNKSLYTEPIAKPEMEKWKKLATDNNTEILTNKELGEQDALYMRYTTDCWADKTEAEVASMTTFSKIAQKQAPDAPNAQWAIDATNMHFMVFEPK